MKKILILLMSLMVMVGVVSCVGCDKSPSKRAFKHNSSPNGMMYYFTLYLPIEGTSHSVSLKCPKQGYLESYIYTDDLGVVSGTNLIWNMKVYEGNYLPMITNESEKRQAKFIFTKKDVTIKGLVGDLKVYNGTYNIETSSPDSWGVPITN